MEGFQCFSNKVTEVLWSMKRISWSNFRGQSDRTWTTQTCVYGWMLPLCSETCVCVQLWGGVCWTVSSKLVPLIREVLHPHVTPDGTARRLSLVSGRTAMLIHCKSCFLQVAKLNIACEWSSCWCGPGFICFHIYWIQTRLEHAQAMRTVAKRKYEILQAFHHVSQCTWSHKRVDFTQSDTSTLATYPRASSLTTFTEYFVQCKKSSFDYKCVCVWYLCVVSLSVSLCVILAAALLVCAYI